MAKENVKNMADPDSINVTDVDSPGESLGDEASLQWLSKLTVSTRDDPWRRDSSDTRRFPSFPKNNSLTSSLADEEDSEVEITRKYSLPSSTNSSKVSPFTERKVVAVGVQLKLEGWPGTNISRPELDAHSKELMDYALEKLVRSGDLVVAVYIHKPGKKLPDGRSIQDLPKFMDSAIAAWEALGEVHKIQVEARVKISDKSKPAFLDEASTLIPNSILLSCSLKKFIQKQMFGTHKWGDYCIKKTPRSCTVIVVRHGTVITSSKGEAGLTAPSSKGSSLLCQDSRRFNFSYADLEKVTNYFGNNQLARQTACSSTAYLGNFPGGSIGTVRRYRSTTVLQAKDMAEIVSALGSIRDKKHENVVAIWNVLVDSKYCCVVTDYLPAGCLYDNLHGLTNSRRLTWENRTKIALGMAHGLRFLHSCTPAVVHGCLHSANVLLDLGMEPLLNDYWTMCLHGKTLKEPPRYTLLPGSYGNRGYLAPELEYKGAILPGCSVEGDVYAFGMLLFELVTGQQAYDEARKPHHLFSYARKLAVDKEYRELVDPRLFSSYNLSQVASVLELALRCCDTDVQRRPKMSEVCGKLGLLVEDS